MSTVTIISREVLTGQEDLLFSTLSFVILKQSEIFWTKSKNISQTTLLNHIKTFCEFLVLFYSNKKLTMAFINIGKFLFTMILTS